MARNVEIKARVASLERIRERALVCGARAAGVLHQIDRYFTLDGARREKLRVIDDERFEWIRYRRPEDAGVRESDYVVERLERGDPRLESLLARTPLRTVTKRRELLLRENLRIHLDRVDGLGEFLELEAVVGPAHDEAECRRAVDALLRELGVGPDALLRSSYSDLIGPLEPGRDPLPSGDARCSIRTLGPRDVPVMRALLATFGEAFDELETYGGAPARTPYLERLLGGDSFIAIAALKSGEVVGGLAAYELHKFEQERSEIYVYDLAVAAAHRREGIATALIRELQRIAAARGAWVIFVQADRGDEPAIALYSKLGIREDVLHFDIPVRR